MTKNQIHTASSLLSTCILSALLTGCTLATTAVPDPVAGKAISGVAFGGQQAILNAKVYLLAVNPSGYGGPGIAPSTSNASVSLLNAAATGNSEDSIGSFVLTDASGAFNVSNDYSCTSGYPQGGGTGATATATLVANTVATIAINNPGTNYTSAPTVGFYGGGGTGATATAVVTAGAVTGILVTNPGSGYTSTPTVVFTDAASAQSGNEQVFIYILGGTGSVGSTTNSNSGLLVALGPCNAPYSLKLVANELTTTAAAYAFAGFASDATHIGSSGTALATNALANAGLNSANLVNIATGLPVANSTVGTNVITRPVANIYTIGDILASCVNSNGSTSSGCTSLFAHTKSAGDTGTAATDTASAAINLAHNPWPSAAGMTALYGVIPSVGAPFNGGLSAQPNDFNLALNYTGGTLLTYSGLAIDASGNAWTVSVRNNTITKFSSTGVLLSGTAGYTGGGLSTPVGIAFDPSGYIWTANYANNSLSKFSNLGTPISGTSGYTGGGISGPEALAIDGAGNAWTANYSGFSLSKIANNGTPVSTSAGYTGAGIYHPEFLAIDADSNVWVSNNLNNPDNISKFSNTGTSLSGTTGFTGGGLSDPYGIAIDSLGNSWVVNYGRTSAVIESVSKFSKTGTALSGPGGFTGGGLNIPYNLAIDSANSVFVTNNAGNSITRFSSAGVALSGATGYTAGGLNAPNIIAIDGSGDVWTNNQGNSSLTELIGAAAPVVTPVAANLTSPYGTSAVNRP